MIWSSDETVSSPVVSTISATTLVRSAYSCSGIGVHDGLLQLPCCATQVTGQEQDDTLGKRLPGQLVGAGSRLVASRTARVAA